KVWWTFLRQKFPQDAAAGTMKRLRDLLDPPAGAAGPGPLAEALLTTQGDAAKAAPVRLALAAAHEAAGQFAAAREQLVKAAEAANTADAWIKVGDFDLNRRQYDQAAAAYAEAWKRDKARALPLALQGWALTQAGRADEGRALLDQAHALPLGNVSGRADLAEELSKRDAIEPARRERE